MSFNTFGKLFRFTTWGESHGPAIGCVVDGCPPNIPISEKDVQVELNKRRPGQSKFVTQRKEKDLVQILSGVFHETHQIIFEPDLSLFFELQILTGQVFSY